MSSLFFRVKNFSYQSGKCSAELNVWAMLTELHCFANTCFEGFCFIWCEWFIVAVLCFLVDGFWYEACCDVLQSRCCDNSVRRGLLYNEHPRSNFRRFIANGLLASLALYKRTASCMFSLSCACARKRSMFDSSPVTSKSSLCVPAFSSMFQSCLDQHYFEVHHCGRS